MPGPAAAMRFGYNALIFAVLVQQCFMQCTNVGSASLQWFLVGGFSELEGRIELCQNGDHLKVCQSGDADNQNTAKMVCSELGFSGEGTYETS